MRSTRTGQTFFPNLSLHEDRHMDFAGYQTDGFYDELMDAEGKPRAAAAPLRAQGSAHRAIC